jgi:class 3 adenylate cyclase/tetratricopeptide (TPR) repeat protein
VLFADLVGHTTYSEGHDPEDVRELLSAYFEVCSTVVRRYGGVVEKFIGDAVMAVWGVPTAHEDDAERAVRAGLELVTEISALGERSRVPSLRLRVGIVSGEVATTIGAVDQGMVAGDAVNTAARIQSLASAGEVWVDEATRALTLSAVTFEDRGEHLVKGKTEPVRVHRAAAIVAALGGEQRVDGLEAPLVGRDRDLRLLKELFHSAEESRRPHLVVVDGEGGIGKSRLAWELEKYVDGLSRTVRWSRGRCLSYGDGVAFWALAEAVRGRLGLGSDESSAAALPDLDRVLEAHVTDESERSWLRPRVASLLGEESRDFSREDLFAAWARFFERIAGPDPMVLVIDDAQHMDDGLAEFLEFLLTRATFGCCVIALARPELLERRPHLGARRATPLRLEPLRDEDMGRLVAGLVDGLPDELRRGLVERAGGIPLYAVETVRALIDRDLVVPSGGRYVVAAGTELDLATLGPPATLHALVAARLDALAPEERRVLTDASVLGETFTYDEVAIFAHEVADLGGVLESLVRKELVKVDTDRFSAERGSYRFVQTVVRQVAYGTLSRRDRCARHLAVAERLERDTDRADELAQIIAQHLLDAAAVTSDPSEVDSLRGRAGDLLRRAGERAVALGGFVDASRAFAAAVELVGDPLEQARILRMRGQALSRLNDHEAAAEDLQRSIELFEGAGDVLGAAETFHSLARALGSLERGEEAQQGAAERLAALEALDHPDRAAVARVRAMLLSGLAFGRSFSGDHEGALPQLHEALRITDRIDDPETYLLASGLLAVHQFRVGSRRVAATLLRRLVEDSREAESWHELSLALTNLAVIEAVVDLDEGIRLTDESIHAALDHGVAPDDVLWSNLANYAFSAGRWERVDEVLDAVTASPVPLRLASFVLVGVLAQLRWCGAPARELERPQVDYAGIFPGVQEVAEGSVALAAGDLETATELLWRATRSELATFGLSDDLAHFWPLATWASVEAGRLPEDLPDMVRRFLDETGPTTGLAGQAHVTEALLASRQPEPDAEKVETGFRHGVEVLERSGFRLWAARGREALGAWLLDQGRTEDGRLELAAARAYYEGLGAARWVERVDRLVVAQRTGAG